MSAGNMSAVKVVLTASREICEPIWLPPGTYNKVGIWIGTVGINGTGLSSVRIGLRAFNAAINRPSSAAPIIDVGVIDGTLTNLQTITLGTPYQSPGGWVYVSITGQLSGTAVAAGLAVLGSATMGLGNDPTQNALGNDAIGWYQNAVAGALPSTFVSVGSPLVGLSAPWFALQRSA